MILINIVQNIFTESILNLKRTMNRINFNLYLLCILFETRQIFVQQTTLKRNANVENTGGGVSPKSAFRARS